MKKYFRNLVFLFFCILFLNTSNIYGQTKGKTELVLVSPKSIINKYYTIEELNVLSKGDLITIYKDRFKVLINLMPYCALSAKPGVTLKDLGIPENADNKALLEKEEKSMEVFDQYVNSSLDNFIAYADKNNIVWSILFYEETIRKISLGKEY